MEILQNIETLKNNDIENLLNILDNLEFEDIGCSLDFNEEIFKKDFKIYIKQNGFAFYDIDYDISGKKLSKGELNKLNKILCKYLIDDFEGFTGLRIYIYKSKVYFGFYGSSGTRTNDYYFGIHNKDNCIIDELILDESFKNKDFIINYFREKVDLINSGQIKEFKELEYNYFGKLFDIFGGNIKKIDIKLSDIISFKK